MKENKSKKMPANVMLSILALALMLWLGMANDAFAADWTVYQGNDNHNGVITNAPISSSANVSTIALTKNGSGGNGVDNVPIMQTVGENTYAYVLYDGYNANIFNGPRGGARLVKINCNTATEVWNVQLPGKIQLANPMLIKGSNSMSENDDTIFLSVEKGGSSIIKVTELENNRPSLELFKFLKKEHINTPITRYGEYIYFGTWSENGDIEGTNAPGLYYQVNISNPDNTQTVPSISKGFYWAGAVAVENELYFGGDGGYLYHRPMGSGFGTSANSEIYASAITLPAISGNAAGDVRSTVCLDNGRIYFTSKGLGNNGNLYCYDVSTSTSPAFKWGAKLAGTCTSTPTVADSGVIYVGVYKGFNTGGIQAVMEPERGNEGTAVTINPIGWNQPVQCSPLVESTAEGDYIFVNTNSATGAGYCFFTPDFETSTQKWSTPANTYALGGMACSNGYIVFGNDYDNLYIIFQEPQKNISFEKNGYTAAIPQYGANKIMTKALVKDTNGNIVQDSENIRYSIEKPYNGVFINNKTGEITISSGTEPTSLKIIAKYKDLTASVSLNLSQSIEEEGRFLTNAGSIYNIPINVSNVTRDNSQNYTLNYDSAALIPIDLCGFTLEKETNIGAITEAGIIIKSASNGKIVMNIDKNIPDNKTWSGVINTIIFKAKTTGETQVTVQNN